MSLHVSGQPGPGRQAYQETDGSWTVEVNSVPNLEAAKRLFVEKYDRSPAESEFPWCCEDDLSEDFSVIELTPLEK